MKPMKYTLGASLLMAAFASGASTPQIDFNVEAVIPDNAFYVTALGGWDANSQKMSWNESSNSLTSFNQQLQMKNANGGIKAWLSSQPALTSSAGTDVINLSVSLAGKKLPITSASAVTLYDKTEAGTEKTATMEVSQESALGSRPVAGNYMGAVTMVFDTVAP